MYIHEYYMQRCLDLALLGTTKVATNPLVGAVLVYQNKIIGEGYHKEYGKAHAEVNCIESVSKENKQYISSATLYISLEPCNHFGKTPPCTELIVLHKITKVVVGTKDNFSEVNGKGVRYLRENGVSVTIGILQEKCIAINKHFFYANSKRLPYITIKWAQSADQFCNANKERRTIITNTYTQRWVHWQRAKHQAILVGSNTIRIDNPTLDCRYYSNYQPIIIVIDRQLQLQIKDYTVAKANKLIVVNALKETKDENIVYWKLEDRANFIKDMLKRLYKEKIHSVLVEGGPSLQQQLLNSNFATEIITITNEKLFLQQGIMAPKFLGKGMMQSSKIGNDSIEVIELQ